MSEKALDKIKKLLALAKSTSSEHEAANALRMAQKLMREYQLSETDVKLHEIAEKHTKCANAANKQPSWAALLAQTVCRAFGIDYFLSWRRDIGRSITFYGPKDRVEIGTYCYEVLAPQLVKARKTFQAALNKRLLKTTKINRSDLFAEGWITSVYRKVEALVPTEEEQQLVQLYQEKNHPSLVQIKNRSAEQRKRDMGGYFEGLVQGRNAQLNAGVAGAAQARISQTNLGLKND